MVGVEDGEQDAKVSTAAPPAVRTGVASPQGQPRPKSADSTRDPSNSYFEGSRLVIGQFHPQMVEPRRNAAARRVKPSSTLTCGSHCKAARVAR